MTNFEEIKNMNTPKELGSFLCNLLKCEECPLEKKCNPYLFDGEDLGIINWLKEESK